jgi:hypothetical protein
MPWQCRTGPGRRWPPSRTPPRPTRLESRRSPGLPRSSRTATGGGSWRRSGDRRAAPARTTVAVNLAFEAAAAGGEVLLVDADTYGGAVAHAILQ